MLQKWTRTSLAALQTEDWDDPRGTLMISEVGQVNTASMKVLSSTVDTIRQLYLGTMKSDKLEQLQDAYANHENYTTAKGVTFSVGGAMVGGYKYKLQNNDIGLTIMLKHRYHDHDTKASHVKIDLSSKLIQSKDPVELQHYMDAIASYWLDISEPAGCAVHLACDVQGWVPPSDFLNRFVCRSKRISTNTGISQLSIESGEIATTYNYGQSMLFGTARSMQCAVYNKTAEAMYRGKLHYWEALWQRLGGDEPFTTAYNPEVPVWRIEFRFHQSVIKEFAHGTLDKTGRYNWINTSTGEEVGTDWQLLRYIDIVPHLSGLWRKAATSFRLDTKRGKLIDPWWQRLIDDPLFFETEHTLEYRRLKRPKSSGIEKNIQLTLGNLLAIFASKGFSLNQAMQGIKGAEIWDELVHYYESRGVDRTQIRELVNQTLIRHRLTGKAL